MFRKKNQFAMSQIQSLRDIACKVVASEIERFPEDYVKQLRTLELEYLKLVVNNLSYQALEKFYNSGFYKDAISYKLISQRMKETEDHYRHLFATDRENRELANPHLMLIDVYADQIAFNYHPGYEEENQIPRVFPRKDKETSGPAIVPQDEFLRRFSLFTEDQLKGLNWANVFVAGGSIVASISQAKCGSKKHEIRDFFHRQKVFASSDVDLFIYGLSPEKATEKLQEIFEVVQENNPNTVICVRTAQTVSLVSQYPYRHIQIVLRLYKSPAEILMGFDLDSVTVGFDGSKVLALPRFHRAITRQYNLVDLSRRSTTYEFRLHKYSQRGFEVAVPELDRSKINKSLIQSGIPKHRKQKPTVKLSGLAKLLSYELPLPFRTYTMTIADTRNSEFVNVYGDGPVAKSDYSVVFLPWGPKYSILQYAIFTIRWSAERTRELLNQIDYSRKYADVEKPTVQQGKSILKILESGYSNFEISTNQLDDYYFDNTLETDEVDPKVLPKRLVWLTVDPGRQYIGSFRPEDPKTWFDQAYIDSPNTIAVKKGL